MGGRGELSSRIKTKNTARTSTSTGQPQTTKNYHPSMSAVDILKNPGMEPSTSGLALNLGIKKAEHRRIDAFELWFWRRLLRVPWQARRSNQSILKEISPEYSLEGLMLKLKLQYFGYLMQRADSLEKDPDAGKD